jgi:hypothetical protein
MTVESVTYISDLDDTYPELDDPKSEGDDHLRNIKTGLSGTFPNFAGVAMTATEAELNILDGATVTTAEVNIIDGGTSATATTVADADRVVLNDNGTMVQAAVTDLDTYFAQTTKTLTNKTLTSPAINTGTLTSPVINTGVSGTAVLDDDSMATATDTTLATSESIKAYIDAQVATIVNYAGMVDISANNVVSGNATVDAWTVSSAATGTSIVTHSLGTTDYSVVVTPYEQDGASTDYMTAIIANKGANSFTIETVNESFNLQDADYDFILVPH